MHNSSLRRDLKMELGDNFGGFGYTIPPPFDTVELENIWSELSDINGGVNTVEILTSDAQFISENRLGVGSEDGNSSKISKPRRRDYIMDAEERRKYFEGQFQKLTLHFHRTISRTGCEGDLTALFEGKIVNTARTVNPVLSCTMPTVSDSSHLDSSETEHLSPGEVDDHRYAATMLTQKVSSSAVTDHQYNEKTLMPNNDSDDEFEEDKPKRRRKRLVPYDYIKVRYARDQTFSKFAKSLFRQKIILEERTAATVMLSLKYERCSFNEENYSDAYNIILCSRKPLKIKPPRLAPKKPENQTPVTFILPRYGPFTLPSSSVPSSPTTSLLMSTSAFSAASASAAGLLMPTSTFSTSESSVGQILLPTDFSSPVINLQTLSEFVTAASSNSVSHPEAREQASSSTFKISTSSRESSPSRGTSPSHASDITDYRDLLALEGSGQQSPELNLSVTKGATVDCSTNTEPICSICQKVGVDGKERSKVFWIRCNDPFCYDMVHASCVGFMITCSSHLKQLPSFYCKAHR